MDVTSRFTRNPVHQPMPRKDRPWWKQPTVTIPIVISLVAVLFTGGTYWDNHQSDMRQIQQDIAASEANQQADARLVSFHEVYGAASMVIVENLGQYPIYRAALNVVLLIGLNQPVQLNKLIYLGQLPPCSNIEAKLSQHSVIAEGNPTDGWGVNPFFVQKVDQAAAGKAPWSASVAGLYFYDTDHRSWELSGSGFGQLNYVPALTVSNSVRVGGLRTAPASGCA
jgi:hypothetical protein